MMPTSTVITPGGPRVPRVPSAHHHHHQQHKRRFGMILASRGNDKRPSDLEFTLRSYCQRVDVKGKSLSGAHLVFTTERMAIRAYYPCDIQDLEEKEAVVAIDNNDDRNRSSSIHNNDMVVNNTNDHDDDFDDLHKFLRSFQLVLVLFILPDVDVMMKQLNDTTSFFHRAQRLVRKLSIEYNHSINNNHGTMENDGTNNHNKNLRVMLLPDTQAAVDCLMGVADSITPERIKHKKEYYERLVEKNFLSLPPSSSKMTGKNMSHSTTNGSASAATTTTTPAAVSIHVAETLRTLGQRLGWPSGEVDVLINTLPGGFQSIVTASDDVLDTIPINVTTKRSLQTFFGGTISGRGPARRSPHRQQQQHIHREGASRMSNISPSNDGGNPTSNFPGSFASGTGAPTEDWSRPLLFQQTVTPPMTFASQIGMMETSSTFHPMTDYQHPQQEQQQQPLLRQLPLQDRQQPFHQHQHQHQPHQSHSDHEDIRMSSQYGGQMHHQHVPGDGWGGNADFMFDDVARVEIPSAVRYTHKATPQPSMDIGHNEAPSMSSSHQTGFMSGPPLLHPQNHPQPYYQPLQQSSPQNPTSFSGGNNVMVGGNGIANMPGHHIRPFKAVGSSNYNNTGFSGALHGHGSYSYQQQQQQPSQPFPQQQQQQSQQPQQQMYVPDEYYQHHHHHHHQHDHFQSQMQENNVPTNGYPPLRMDSRYHRPPSTQQQQQQQQAGLIQFQHPTTNGLQQQQHYQQQHQQVPTYHPPSSSSQSMMNRQQQPSYGHSVAGSNNNRLYKH